MHLLGKLDQLCRSHSWPSSSLPLVHDAPSQAWESLRAGALLPVFELAVGESCPVVVELRATRGLVARMAARAIWDATVVAVGHWCGPHATAYHEGWRKAAPAAFPLFARDLAECRARTVPLRKTPGEALDELKKFDISPGVVIAGGVGEEVAADVARYLEAFPAARFVGAGWRGPVGDAVRRVACRLELEVHVVGDGWLVWRDDEPWIEVESAPDVRHA